MSEHKEKFPRTVSHYVSEGKYVVWVHKLNKRKYVLQDIENNEEAKTINILTSEIRDAAKHLNANEPGIPS